MEANKTFAEQVRNNIECQGADADLNKKTWDWVLHAAKLGYTYNFQALGRPIIQFPQDMVAMQELIWACKPDLIIETGIAHGGSLVMSASMLALLDYCDAVESKTLLDPSKPKRKVLGIDIDIRPRNREAIEAHPMANRIEMLVGSAIDEGVIAQVKARAADFSRIMVCLDSNHTHEHVLAELKAYAPLVSIGSYCVVFDTAIEDAPVDFFPNRSWGPGNNPKTAVWEYLKSHPEFSIDKSIDHKLLISVAPDGYLKKVG